MRERREISTRADASLLRNWRIDIRVEQLEEKIDELRSSAGVTLGNDIGAQQHHRPLVTLKTGSPVVAPSLTISREFVESELTLTPLGREVLAGKKDWQTINKKSRWLGGV